MSKINYSGVGRINAYSHLFNERVYTEQEINCALDYFFQNHGGRMTTEAVKSYLKVVRQFGPEQLEIINELERSLINTSTVHTDYFWWEDIPKTIKSLESAEKGYQDTINRIHTLIKALKR